MKSKNKLFKDYIGLDSRVADLLNAWFMKIIRQIKVHMNSSHKTVINKEL
jgi:hypothetical protein